MSLSIVAIIAGFAILVWSADRFVLGASALAQNLGVPTLIIGMIIMGFGTSAPEIFVATIASMGGNPGLALGNALGSNIANIGLVLGIGALIAPLTVHSQILKREYPSLLIVTAALFLILMDNEITNMEGYLLLLGTLVMVAWLTWLSYSSRTTDSLTAEIESELPERMTTPLALFWTFLSLVLLVGSSHMLVWGATDIAKAFGISDLVIGLTIIAIGTSLPEIAVSVSAALKKEHDLVIGNVIGSNMFNSLAVIGIGTSIEAVRFPDIVILRDYSTMVVLTLALFVMSYGFRRPGRINRFEAAVLLSAYIAYMVTLYITEAK